MTAEVTPVRRAAALLLANGRKGRDAALDAIAADAAHATGAPVAIVTLIDREGDRILGAYGWNVDNLPGQFSLATPLAVAGELVVVPDAAADPCFRQHPLVKGAPEIRFLTGVPLSLGQDFIGALAVLDRVPRAISPEQVHVLGICARSAMAEIACWIERHERESLAQRLSDLEATAEESDERFREFFEKTSDLVLSIDAAGRLLHANEALFNAVGRTRDDLLHQPLLRIIEQPAREEFNLALEQVMSTGETHTIETVFLCAGGRRMIVEGPLNPKTIDGKGVLARVIFRDVTDRHQYEAELGRARDAALESARLKTQFLTNVSHEIRTPMNGIVGMIDLLLSTRLDVEQQDFAHQARSNAEQLLSVVNNILHVSAVEAGGLAAIHGDFDLQRTLQRIVEVMRVTALGKDLEVRMEYDPQLPQVFRGQQSKIRQVVGNLLENGVKFTEQGSVTLRVALQTETDTHRVVRFEVRDTGIGISIEDRLLLFEKFSQIDATSTRRYQGVGLGLATARHLVETMGGLIDVQSVPGVGSTFFFTIPFPKPAGSRSPIPTSDLELKDKRVLLCDQYATSRRVVQHYLATTWEMRVDVIEDGTERGAEALAILRRAAAAGDPYRVVIFDRMPDVSELAFAREVKNDPAIAGTRMVFLLDGSREPNEEAMRESGISAYLAKPVGQSELFDALTIALAHAAVHATRPAAQPSDSRARPPAATPEQRKGIRVLLAEDNFLNMKLTMSQLYKLGYVADSVANGKEALEALEKHDYDLILLDCQMPIIDGYEAAAEIRRREGSRHHRIIAMTANALSGDREKCLAAGMDDYLAKPTRQEDLEIALDRYFVGN
ncbi:MAG TPA: response regulator [Thermoanaerobaculia bacterium]|nr:response regulator [Thermoanaerobaculia bacterium]